jgi:type VI secretion system protein ImpL
MVIFKGLFSEVILKDKNLVKQHINPNTNVNVIWFIASLLGVSIILGYGFGLIVITSN